MFEQTISLGNILTIVAFLVGGLAFAYSIKSDTRVGEVRLTMIDAQIEDFKVEVRKLNEILVTLAGQAGRLDNLEERLTMQGKRLDSAIDRINDYVDHRVPRLPGEY